MTKCNIEFRIENYVYEKEKIQANINGTEIIHTTMVSKKAAVYFFITVKKNL